MFTSDLKTFHDAITPLIYFNWIVGTGAFRQPNQTTSTYISMKLYTVFVTVMGWITIYITLNALAGAVAPDNTSPLALNMLKVLVYANSSMTLIAPLLVRLESQGLADCMRKIAILDNTFLTVLGIPKEYRKWYNRLTCHVTIIWLVMFLVGVCDSVFDQQIEQQLSMNSALMFCCVSQTLHRPIAVMLLLDLNFGTFVGYLRKKFRDLNDSLVALTEKPPASYSGERSFTISQNATKMIPGNDVANAEAGSLIDDKRYLLREIRKAHLELCKLSQKINRAFGIQNLISTGISFVMITGLLYTIYSVLSWKDFDYSMLEKTIPLAIWTFLYVSKIWIVNHTCWRVSNEAERTGEIIYELLNSRTDKELRKVIQEFGVQMLQNPVRFNACGFFNLDHASIQGVIGSITTYLVILIQMSPASESPTSDTAILP